MWLLSTDRAELHYFSRPFDADGGYATLSHTWDKTEQTFQEVRRISERCQRDKTNPRDDPELSPKIRGLCILAAKHGYQWAWADSCCIDKTSSSELSESVNSMYRWYSDCEVCYAYLSDVPGSCVPEEAGSAFRKSRWHTRGWTLQELIAPARLLFMSSDWAELGDRTSRAILLEEITGIDARILTRKKRPSDFSVASRMHWASRRKTTRVEDEAYCLMGLFDVTMPANYGEGERAFTRLQYEIMRHSSDTSLFVFGDDILPRGDFSTHGIVLDQHVEICDTWQFLLASSPREFETRAHYAPRSRRSSITDGEELPRISVTSYGVKLRLPVFEADGLTIAVLLCCDSIDYLGLILSRDMFGEDDPTRPRYYTGCRWRSEKSRSPVWCITRMARLGPNADDLHFNGKRVEGQWRTFYVVPHPPEVLSPSATTARLTINCSSEPPFRFPNWLISRFLALRSEVTEHVTDKTHTTISIFRIGGRPEQICVDLGLCADRQGHFYHWAKVTIYHEGMRSQGQAVDRPESHSCARHHVLLWPSCSWVFGNSERSVRLSFTPCKRLPGTTLVVHLELLGPVYEDILHEADVSFPPLPPPSARRAPIQ